jgi:hypothetical protein
MPTSYYIPAAMLATHAAIGGGGAPHDMVLEDQIVRTDSGYLALRVAVSSAVRTQRFAREGAVGGGRVLYYLVKPSPGHYLARQR